MGEFLGVSLKNRGCKQGPPVLNTETSAIEVFRDSSKVWALFEGHPQKTLKFFDYPHPRVDVENSKLRSRVFEGRGLICPPYQEHNRYGHSCSLGNVRAVRDYDHNSTPEWEFSCNLLSPILLEPKQKHLLDAMEKVLFKQLSKFWIDLLMRSERRIGIHTLA